MFETSIDELFLPFGQEEKLVDGLLSDLGSAEERDGSSASSLARAFCPAGGGSPSLPLVPPDCSTRYKTELCSSYSSTASCKYAEHCQFAHGLHELRTPFRHPKYKTELCRNYHTTGYCYYGVRCLFVHSPEEQRAVVRRRRNVPCRNQRSFGVCPFGTRCIFLHAEGKSAGKPEAEEAPPAGTTLAKDEKPSKTLCYTFSTFGFCLEGTSCLFQHCLPSKKSPLSSSSSSERAPEGPAAPPPQQRRRRPAPSRLPLPTSTGSSTSASPPPTPSPDATAHNAFTFSSRHLSELLLPLAFQLQRLDSTKAQEIWDNRAV